jgi:hypothetical protein
MRWLLMIWAAMFWRRRVRVAGAIRATLDQ